MVLRKKGPLIGYLFASIHVSIQHHKKLISSDKNIQNPPCDYQLSPHVAPHAVKFL